MAQRGRVRRRALVATEKTGGRNVSRLTLRRTDATQAARLYSAGAPRFGYRDRAGHSDLQFDQRAVAAPAAVQRAGSAGDGLGQQSKAWLSRILGFGTDIPLSPGTQSGLLACLSLRLGQFESRRRRRAGAGCGSFCLGRLFLDAGRAARAWTRLRAT